MKVRQDLAMAQYKDVLLQSFQEVEMGIYSESALREKHRSLELAYEQIFAAEQQVNKHYEAGLANSFELLTLQERRIRTETDLMRSHYEILANRIRLILALGERFPIDVEPNIEVVH